MKNQKIIAAFLLAILWGPGFAENPKNTAVLTMPDGSKVEAELALTPQAQERGLMFRESLPDNRGMIFVFKDGGVKTFWMKNTYISLDIVFMDAGMKVTNVYHRVPRSNPEQPEAEVAKVSAPASYVLELAAGKAKKCGLKPDYVVKSSVSFTKKNGPAVKKSTGAAVSAKKQPV